MPRLAPYFIACIILGGCAAPATIQTTPDLTVAGKDPYAVKVNLTNNADHALAVSSSGFRLVDANGGAYGLYAEGKGGMSDIAFPHYFNLGAGETVRGWLSFYTVGATPPYVVKYDYAGAKAETPFTPTG